MTTIKYFSENAGKSPIYENGVIVADNGEKIIIKTLSGKYGYGERWKYNGDTTARIAVYSISADDIDQLIGWSLSVKYAC
jgi:hypothetical protein